MWSTLTWVWLLLWCWAAIVAATIWTPGGIKKKKKKTVRGRCGVLRRQRGNNWNQGLVGVKEEKKKTKTLHSEAHLAFSVWVSTKKAEAISINKNQNDCKLERLPWGVLQSVQHFNDLRSRISFYFFIFLKQSLNKRTFSGKLEQTSELNQVSCAEETIGGFAKLSVKMTLHTISN